jgi:cbb3-type cytochrome oxidase cytochrome c subunit
MNHGPLIFLGVLFALACSWWGLVAGPHKQIGNLQQTNALATAEIYPLARPGLAQRGAEVYRANGCFYCHSQQVRQSGVTFDLVITGLAVEEGQDPSDKQARVLTAIQRIRPNLPPTDAANLLAEAPQAILQGVSLPVVEDAKRRLDDAGATTDLVLVPFGADIEGGWGLRRSVAYDYLYDSPVMLGSQRIGPDLANVGARLPDAQWQLIHLYNPRIYVKGSTMPQYRYLFETRRITSSPSPDALRLPEEFAPASGYEVVPTADATALVAYLGSLRSSAPLFEAPYALPPGGGADTNATNAAQNAAAPAANNP